MNPAKRSAEMIHASADQERNTKTATGNKRDFVDLKSTYNKIAKEWANQHAQDDWWKTGTDTFLSFVPRGGSVLDVGCGSGNKTRYIAEKGYKAVGIDFSEKMIECARRDSPEILFDVVDLYEIEKYPKTFDALFAQAVILHVPKNKVMQVLRNFKDKLVPGGILYLGVKEVKDTRPVESVIKENDYGFEYERFFSFYTPEELRGYMKELGMEIMWEGNVVSGRTNWIQIVGKKI